MDGKYGRLFTERDVKLLMRYAYSRGEEGEIADEDEEGLLVDAGAVLLGWYEQDSADGPFAAAGALTFPADEPLFLLRGQDKATPEAIDSYGHECEAQGAPDDHWRAVQQAAASFERWQAAHLERVKVPD